MNNLVVQWLAASRAKFLIASWIPVGVGLALVHYEKGSINLLTALLTLTGVSFLHLATNMCNDYYDYLSGNDSPFFPPTPFSGGSRMIQNNIFSAKHIFTASVILFMLGASIGIMLIFTAGITVGIIGMIGSVAGFFYTAPPVKIGYRGWGEFTAGFCFGPLVVTGTWCVQSANHIGVPFLCSIPMGICVSLILLINEFPDYPADSAVNKNTIVVRLNPRSAAPVFSALIMLLYIYTGILLFLRIIPQTQWIVFVTIPLALFLVFKVHRYYLDREKLLPANAGMIAFMLIFGILYILGFIFG